MVALVLRRDEREKVQGWMEEEPRLQSLVVGFQFTQLGRIEDEVLFARIASGGAHKLPTALLLTATTATTSKPISSPSLRTEEAPSSTPSSAPASS